MTLQFCATAHNPAIVTSLNRTKKDGSKEVPCPKALAVTGWGLTELQLPSDELLMAHLPVQSNQLCVEAYANVNITLNISDGMFCAGFPTGRTSTCRGDSGSPLVFYDRDSDQHTVEGLVSFGINGQCDLPDRYTVFTRVAYFMPWILRNWPR
ncbi:limulus clotting factor C [Trichonephila clavipes]|nr:limulus clotting factor C [Trichonephila clavipes]